MSCADYSYTSVNEYKNKRSNVEAIFIKEYYVMAYCSELPNCLLQVSRSFTQFRAAFSGLCNLIVRGTLKRVNFESNVESIITGQVEIV